MYPTKADQVGGIFIRNEVLELKKSGIDVRVVVPSLAVPPFSKKYALLKSPLIDPSFAKKRLFFSAPNWSFPFIAGYSISRILMDGVKHFKPDIIHIHTGFPCSLSLLYAKRVNCPVVITLHGSDWYKAVLKTSTASKLKSALNKADSIITVGNQLRSSILKDIPEIENKLITRHHGINVDNFPLTTNRIPFKTKLGLDTGKPLLLTIANRSQEKGLDFLLESIAEHEILKKTPLVIIGKRGSSSYELKLQQIIQENNLDLVDIKDAIPHHELLDWYSAADVYIQPSKSEGFGIAIIEAAATGCPVVATTCGGPEETVTSAVGSLVNFGDKEALANHIITMLRNKNWDGAKERAEIITRFNKEEKTKSLINHYNKVLNEYHTEQKK